jgi:glycosyltransferase involved in cell wall biosynthesis
VADRALHIGIDGRELVGKPTGVGRYLLSVLRVWADDAGIPHRFTIFLPSDAPAPVKALGDRFTAHVEPTPKAGTIWEQTRLASAVAEVRPDVFFAAGYTAPLRLTCPSVVAVYDVSFFAHPEWFATRERLRRQWTTKAAAKSARRVVTISQFSADEIVRWLDVPRDRIVVAPPAAPAVPEAESVTPRPPIALFVGSLFNRRRIPELLQAFAQVARAVSDARLLLIGDNRTHPPVDPRALSFELGIGDRVDWREYAPDAELNNAYRQARVFVFLSDYEGFAMTPLEALAHGVPSVLLDTPISREVYGEAARLVGPDPTTIANALKTLLTNDAVHAELLARGRERLAALSWVTTAAAVRAALEQAADE